MSQKFSHSEALKSGDARANTRGWTNPKLNPSFPRPSGAQAQARDDTEFRNWRHMIPRTSHGQSRPLGVHELSRFFTRAFDMVLARDPSMTQQVISSLSSEGGLLRVVELTEIPLDDLSISSKLRSFEEVYLPFLQLITHEDVLPSLVLEVHIGTIYTVLYGNNGQRAVPMFKSLAGAVFDLKFNNPHEESSSVPASMRAVLTALSRVVEVNQSACINPGFLDAVEILTNCIGGHNEDAMTNIDMQGAVRSLEKIRARLGLGSLMPLGWDTSAKAGPAEAAPVFELEQDTPGRLLAGGARHDNDHADIFDIKIMPTAQEIQSQHQEYLPVSDPRKLHLAGIGGLLDRHFRLLREDTVGQLRDTVRLVIKQLRAPEGGTSRIWRRGLGARVFLYEDVLLTDVKFEMKSGLHVLVEFDQLPEVRSLLRAKQRAEFWSDSKRLLIESLLCLVDSGGRSTFLCVSGRNSDYKSDEDTAADGAQDLSAYSLWNNRTRAAVTVQPVESENDQLIRRFESQNNVRQVLLEFPGVLLPSFRPTLQALQQMSRQHEIPFSALLAPSDDGKLGSAEFTPPAYSLQRGFRFNLSAITSGANLALSPSEPFDGVLRELKQHSTLDDAQCSALVHGLTNSLALIQGPPGTGKSYVGVKTVKVLLDNRKEAKLGPIICVCYTNHALDQILENLSHDGINQIIRLGSQSKSEILKSRNLIAVSQEMERTKTEKQRNWELQRKLESDGVCVRQLLEKLGGAESDSTIRRYLEVNHSEHHRQLFGDNEDGYKTVRYRSGNIIDRWLRGRGSKPPLSPPSGSRPIRSLLNEPLFSLSIEERICLYKHWTTDIKNELVGNLLIASEDYTDTKNELGKCRKEIHLRCLQQAHVIGATTTGLARNIDLLRRLPSKVLLCEEAGEVLEAHILTELRPQINNFDLSLENPRGRKYSLDVSLFERLIRPSLHDQIRVPFVTLEVQRRMHPSIADLVRQTLYPKLKDHPSVAEFPQVSGIRRRLFWLDHREKEAGKDATQPNQVSHWNSHEVEMVAALVSHLVRQGAYKSGEIAVITPYLLQLRKIQERLSSAFEIVIGDRDIRDLEKKGLDEAETGQAVQPTPRKTTLLNALRVATVVFSANGVSTADIHALINAIRNLCMTLSLVWSLVQGLGKAATTPALNSAEKIVMSSARLKSETLPYRADTLQSAQGVMRLSNRIRSDVDRG
ncbi:hypothetical protein GP486_001741 [Trichoglossum hirsutum]|uniref:Uncharacterized protein n=1 Tax=Trichoglossum hirsutum TaxID=265104 RepID=A0A9P8RSS2_9PEZI|nr:hypothetical protein GP486_001741 [Trichoglossum hirsutum]